MRFIGTGPGFDPCLVFTSLDSFDLILSEVYVYQVSGRVLMIAGSAGRA